MLIRKLEPKAPQDIVVVFYYKVMLLEVYTPGTSVGTNEAKNRISANFILTIDSSFCLNLGACHDIFDHIRHEDHARAQEQTIAVALELT